MTDNFQLDIIKFSTKYRAAQQPYTYVMHNISIAAQRLYLL